MAAAGPLTLAFLLCMTIGSGTGTTEPSAGSAEDSLAPDVIAKDSLLSAICTRYLEGMPLPKKLALGAPALPRLAGILQDKRYKRCWANACSAIGVLGETTYLDTLLQFVWSPHGGTVDWTTFKAINTAQGSIGLLAAGSDSGTVYLIRMTEPDAWRALPWNFPERDAESTRRMLARTSVLALAYVDEPRARAFVDTLSVGHFASIGISANDSIHPVPSRLDSIVVEDIRRTSNDVRSLGLHRWLELQGQQ